MSQDILDKISEAIKTLESGEKEEVLGLLTDIEKKMNVIIEIIKVEDKNFLIDAAAEEV